EHQVSPAGRDPDGMDVLGPLGDPHVAVDRAALLREAGHVDDADALALEMRRHAENAADGDDAGAADTGDDDVVGPAELGMRGLRQRHDLLVLGHALALLQLRTMHGDEGRAEALHAGEVFVAGRLVDGALPAEFGLQRLHRNAVRLHAAVAAALADQLVDDDAFLGVRECAAFAAAALLGGAGLVVNQHGTAGDFRQFLLHRLQIVAMVEGDALRPFDAGRIFLRLVADDDDALGAFGRDLRGDLRHAEIALVGLAAG